MPFISFLIVINQIQALIVLHPLIIMVIHTHKGPDLAASSVVIWEGKWVSAKIVKNETSCPKIACDLKSKAYIWVPATTL